MNKITFLFTWGFVAAHIATATMHYHLCLQNVLSVKEIESISHLFYDCTHSHTFWVEVFLLIPQLTQIHGLLTLHLSVLLENITSVSLECSKLILISMYHVLYFSMSLTLF